MLAIEHFVINCFFRKTMNVFRAICCLSWVTLINRFQENLNPRMMVSFISFLMGCFCQVNCRGENSNQINLLSY